MTSGDHCESTHWESYTQDFESKNGFQIFFGPRPNFQKPTDWEFMTLQFEFFLTECDKKFKVVETQFDFACIFGRSTERAFQKNLNSSRMHFVRKRVKISRSEKIGFWPNVENIAIWHFLALFGTGIFCSTFFEAITFQQIPQEKHFRDMDLCRIASWIDSTHLELHLGNPKHQNRRLNIENFKRP